MQEMEGRSRIISRGKLGERVRLDPGDAAVPDGTEGERPPRSSCRSKNKGDYVPNLPVQPKVNSRKGERRRVSGRRSEFQRAIIFGSRKDPLRFGAVVLYYCSDDSSQTLCPASSTMDSTDDWTTTHDLAVVYIAIAYGTDHDLSDEELKVLTEALQAWEEREAPAVREVIVEAATAFVEGDAEAEVQRAMRELRSALAPQERRDTVRYLIRIAEADGVLLEREQGFIHALAEAWSLKELSEELLENTSAVVQRRGEDWGLIHELAFLYILVGHTAGEELSPDTIDVMADRLQEWQPERSEEQVREVVRRALQVYADEPGEDLIHDSVEALKQALPSTQRLTVLDDLYTVARADGTITRDERTLIQSLAKAWDVNVRLNGRGD